MREAEKLKEEERVREDEKLKEEERVRMAEIAKRNNELSKTRKDDRKIRPSAQPLEGTAAPDDDAPLPAGAKAEYKDDVHRVQMTKKQKSRANRAKNREEKKVHKLRVQGYTGVKKSRHMCMKGRATEESKIQTEEEVMMLRTGRAVEGAASSPTGYLTFGQIAEMTKFELNAVSLQMQLWHATMKYGEALDSVS